MLLYRNLKNFPYHIGDSVEIKKIQSSKSKVQNKFQIPNPKPITIGSKLLL
jgi:hypothetical protein